ncbi:unnamed protein product [Laminaria digitata]
MWKCLHDDPGTSKLLKQIYGASRPDIAYPKIRTTVPRANLPPAFLPGGLGEPKDRESAAKGRGAKYVRVPKFGKTKKAGGRAPIDSGAIMHRRRGDQIQEEQAANRERMECYRPPYTKPVGEEEKSRLAEKFEFGGGKALPDEMTGPVMPIPSEARWKASEAERVAAVVRRRKGLPDADDGLAEPAGGGGGGGGTGCSPATTMFDQVCTI